MLTVCFRDKLGGKGTHFKTTQFKLTTLTERDDTDDAKYWAKYPAVLTTTREHLWDAMLEGLDKYQSVLYMKKINFLDSI